MPYTPGCPPANCASSARAREFTILQTRKEKEVPARAALFSPRGLALLEAVSLGYAGLPLLLFLWGWLTVYLAAPLCVLLLWGLFRAYRMARAMDHAPPGIAEPSPHLSGWGLLFIIAVGAGTALVSGIGGYTAQWFEHYMFDAILKDLIQAPWPLLYAPPEEGGNPFHFHYYFGYFLPAAAVGKLIGWSAAYHFGFLYAAAGISLVLLWFLRLAGSANPLYVLVFLGFGGLDIVAYLLTSPGPWRDDVSILDYLTGVFPWYVDFPGFTGRGYFDWWFLGLSQVDEAHRQALGNHVLLFSAPLTLLAVSPQHVLPAWLIIAMLLHDGMKRNSPARMAFLWALMPICSPLAALGAAPFVMLAVLGNPLPKSLSLANTLAGIPLLAVQLLYLAGNSLGGMEHASGPLWRYVDPWFAAPYLLLYYVVEFGFIALLTARLRRVGAQPGQAWFLLALTLLALLPLYRMGTFNDLSTKGTIAPQMALMVCVAAALRASAGSTGFRVARRLLAGSLVLGAITTAGIVLNAVDAGIHPAPPPASRVVHVNEAAMRKGITPPANHGLLPAVWRLVGKPAEGWRTSPPPVFAAWDFTDGNARGEDWEFLGESARRTPDGVVLTLDEPGLFMRLSNHPVPSGSVGFVRVDYSVEANEGWQPNHVVWVLWDHSKDGTFPDSIADFPRWNFVALHPFQDFMGSNPRWRGAPDCMGLALQLRENSAPVEEIRITVRGVTFYGR